MGASPLMSLGVRAMNASYAAIQVTGHNIANASVAGYSRQQAQVATAKGQDIGAGFYGRGVDVTTVTRSYDQFLTRAATSAKSIAEMDATRSQRLQQLEDVFPTGETGLGATVGNFLNSMVDLASRPADTASREVVIARAQDVAKRLNAAGSQIETLQAGVTADLKTSAEAVNGIAASLAKINGQIAGARGSGDDPNDLLDERDRLLSELAEKIQFTTVAADDGSVGVFVGGGQSLVLGAKSASLRGTAAPRGATRSALAISQGGSVRVIDAETIGGGSIAALLQFQNEDLVDARNLVGQMAAGVGSAVNAQQQLGLDLRGDAGKAMFTLAEPVARAATTNARDAGGAFLGGVDVKAADGTLLQASDYLLRRADSGWVVARLPDGDEQAVTPQADGTLAIDGMKVTVTGSPATGDRFLLQPVAAAAKGISVAIADARLIAAASPLVASVGSGNAGTARVASLTMVEPGTRTGASISFAANAGTGALEYTWTGTDADGNPTTKTRPWRDDGVVPPEPDSIDGARLVVSGTPKAGDTITVAPIAASYAAANNGNALALAGLRDAAIVGRSEAGGVHSGGATATDAYAALLADVGVRVQNAETAEKISGASAAQAESARSEVSGVNLDEEAARLIQFQQSYQAAAKVLQVAQSLFDTLLQTAAR